MESLLGLTLAAISAIANLAGADCGRPNLILLGVFALAATVWGETVLKLRGWAPTPADVAAVD